MATIALQIAGTAVGSFLGGPFGAAIGSAVGGTVGAMIDRSLLGAGKRVIEGPRLSDLAGISASEGAQIPRVYGRVRIGGQVIWATEFEESRTIERSGSGGGKSLGGGSAPVTETVRYSYFANVAIGLCEGPVAFLRRIWADGEELDLAGVAMRFYPGTEDQAPDPLIVAKQGTAALPGFRGLAYIVFERLPLERYGNRLPQFAFEIVRPAPGLPGMIHAVNIIPGSTEFGYSTGEIREDFGYGASQAVNRAQWTHATDWDASLDQLQALMPELERATLVSAWFGDDLRAAHCTLRPRVEKSGKAILGGEWRVCGLTRAEALPVSAYDGRPNYGGTPADQSVIDAIRDLRARGLQVALHPFILMDIPAGNGRPDPYGGGANQPPFPWRGRITCDPAPGQSGSPEGTPAVSGQIAALIGTASPAHFALDGDTVLYSGPEEWSLRRMVLHHAMLARAAGGVETFILGSELVGLTHLSAGNGAYPFVQALLALISDIRAILGPGTVITYAADWTEYGAQARDGGQELRFPLDPVWAHPEIGAIGIDFYMPLSDWRPGRDHLDAAEAYGPADPDYLRARIASGEGYDWYYADDAARTGQIRQPITDGAYGKPWVFRPKDLAGWWLGPHVERVGGLELGQPTAYPGPVKPIFLTEIGCPAVDKGANQPNVFPDPKSSENAFPYASIGARDDLVQRRALEAILRHFDPSAPDFAAANNPLSPINGIRMVAPGFIAPWAWDARPYPAFPRLTGLWSDGGNWHRGHWLNGRIEAVPIAALIAMIAADLGLDPPAFRAVDGIVDGYVIERPMSARAAIEPLAGLFGLAVRIEGDRVAFIGRPSAVVATIPEEMLVEARDGRRIEITRRQETEMPRRLQLQFTDSERDFRRAVVQAEKNDARTMREEGEAVAIHVPLAAAQRIAETRLQDIWSARESFRFSLARGAPPIEPGDLVEIPTASGPRRVLVDRLTDRGIRDVEGRGLDPAFADDVPALDEQPAAPSPPPLPGPAEARLLELPLPRGAGGLLVASVRAEPWRGPYAIARVDGGGVRPLGSAIAPARIGETLTALPPGPLWRWDHGARLEIRLEGGALASLSEAETLAGGNALALIDSAGGIELVLAREAALIGANTYRLTGLLRGIGLSEAAAGRLLPAGAAFVVL
ncbi:MAG: glycoside hydrolase/phage tail family protein, partial [Rhabdaerophilum calidifontis]